MTLLQIVAPHFVAGIEVDPDTGWVVRAAPIVAYMVGWNIDRVARYVRTKRWRCELVEPD